VKELLAAGADVGAKDTEDKTPLDRTRNASVKEMLKGARENGQQSRTR
jgi:hypothetical protein